MRYKYYLVASSQGQNLVKAFSGSQVLRFMWFHFNVSSEDIEGIYILLPCEAAELTDYFMWDATQM